MDASPTSSPLLLQDGIDPSPKPPVFDAPAPAALSLWLATPFAQLHRIHILLWPPKPRRLVHGRKLEHPLIPDALVLPPPSLTLTLSTRPEQISPALLSSPLAPQKTRPRQTRQIQHEPSAPTGERYHRCVYRQSAPKQRRQHW